MQTAGDLIAAAAELAAGVEYGINDLQRRPPGLGLDVHGDAAAVVGNGDGVAGVDGDGDVLAVARQRFIDGVVHDLIDQMMKARAGGRADIHTGTLAHRFQTLQNLNLRAAVFLCYFRFVRHNFLHWYVIANQCAHWCGNPYSYCHFKGERIATSLRSSQ